MPAFTRVVESKINTALKVGEQSVRAQIYLEDGQEYYGLPETSAASVTSSLSQKGSANLGNYNADSPFGGQDDDLHKPPSR